MPTVPQARSQKFAMGELFGGSGGGVPSRWRPMWVWGQRPQPPKAGGVGAKPPAAAGKILHILQK